MFTIAHLVAPHLFFFLRWILSLSNSVSIYLSTLFIISQNFLQSWYASDSRNYEFKITSQIRLMSEYPLMNNSANSDQIQTVEIRKYNTIFPKNDLDLKLEYSCIREWVHHPCLGYGNFPITLYPFLRDTMQLKRSKAKRLYRIRISIRFRLCTVRSEST